MPPTVIRHPLNLDKQMPEAPPHVVVVVAVEIYDIVSLIADPKMTTTGPRLPVVHASHVGAVSTFSEIVPTTNPRTQADAIAAGTGLT